MRNKSEITKAKDFERSKQWQKENMKSLTYKYNTTFVEDFKKACLELGISQSEVIRQAMEDTIAKASEVI